MLRPLYNLFSIFHQIGALKCLEPEIVVVEISSKIQMSLDLVRVLLNRIVYIVSQHRGRAAHLVLNLCIETSGNLKEIVGGSPMQIRNCYVRRQF